MNTSSIAQYPADATKSSCLEVLVITDKVPEKMTVKAARTPIDLTVEVGV